MAKCLIVYANFRISIYTEIRIDGSIEIYSRGYLSRCRTGEDRNNIWHPDGRGGVWPRSLTFQGTEAFCGPKTIG
jgi:hypothetical protein